MSEQLQNQTYTRMYGSQDVRLALAEDSAEKQEKKPSGGQPRSISDAEREARFMAKQAIFYGTKTRKPPAPAPAPVQAPVDTPAPAPAPAPKKAPAPAAEASIAADTQVKVTAREERIKQKAEQKAADEAAAAEAVVAENEAKVTAREERIKQKAEQKAAEEAAAAEVVAAEKEAKAMTREERITHKAEQKAAAPVPAPATNDRTSPTNSRSPGPPPKTEQPQSAAAEIDLAPPLPAYRIPKIKQLCEAWLQARRSKDWAAAEEIRTQYHSLNVAESQVKLIKGVGCYITFWSTEPDTMWCGSSGPEAAVEHYAWSRSDLEPFAAWRQGKSKLFMT